MRPFYKHNDKVYIVHKAKPIASFTDNSGHVRMDIVKEYRDYLYLVDHVLKNESHFLFVETIQEAKIIEDDVEESEIMVEV